MYIIDANVVLIMTDCNGRVVYECLSRANCEKLYGECKNSKYGNRIV